MKITTLCTALMLASSSSLVSAQLSQSPMSASGPGNDPTGQSQLQYDVSGVTDRIIVKYRDGRVTTMSSSAMTRSVKTMGRDVGSSLHIHRSFGENGQVLSLPGFKPIQEVQKLAERIEQNPDVLYAEPDLLMQPYYVPTDPRFNEQWHYFEAAGGIKLPQAWDDTRGNGVVVAVIDSGIRYHQDLEGQLLPGYDFISSASIAKDGDGRDDNPTDTGDWMLAGECGQGIPASDTPSVWHGTHVAGTIAASTGNDLGVAGVAPAAKIVPIRVLGTCGGYASDIASGIRWAAGLSVTGVPRNTSPAQVINLSLGGASSECLKSYGEAIDEAIARGATVIVAAGNDKMDAALATPANCPGVIAVAANKRDGGYAFYSNLGATIDITAPGGEAFDVVTGALTPENAVLSTLNSGQTTPQSDDHFGPLQGTSMAAPHVAGVAALMYSVNPDLTPEDVEHIIKASARSFPAVDERACDNTLCGAGILDAAAAVQLARQYQSKPRTPVYENTTTLAIPDFSFFGANSVIGVDKVGDAGTITVSIDIKHPNAADLHVAVFAPNGGSVTLESLSHTGRNLQKSYQLDATGVLATGEWSLWIVDLGESNVGSLDAWSIQFEQAD